jgi:alpha-1,6-mannosyltransferase
MAMRICDLTMAYSETSGGIRTYIDHKRRYLREHTSHEHVLIVPGAEDRVESSDRAVTYCIKSPPTGHGTYRLLWRPDAILRALREATPDVVELGTFFVCPWPGLRYREERRAGGRRCITVGYFHTDLAEAYVEGPLADAVHDWLKPWGGAVEHLGLELAEVLGKGAERYFGAIFRRCDAMLAATPDEAARLAEYGIDAPHVIPLGVDLEAFTPQRRDPALRERFGASEDSCIMIYAGRLDAEKHVDVLLEVLSLLLARGVDARLVLVGDGPLKEQLAARARELRHGHLCGYLRDRAELARLLASSDVYVTAGPYETFGLSVVEAQASGLPVVGVDAGALQARVVEGTGFLAPVGDAAAMASHVQAAFAQRVALGRRARAHVEKHFSWHETFARLLAVYEACLRRSTGARRSHPPHPGEPRPGRSRR